MQLRVRSSPLSSASSVHLDAVRGFAALFVLLGHLRTLFYKPYDQLGPHKSAAVAMTYWITSGEIAHECVIVFFVLSGYLVGGSVIRMLAMGRWSWSEYLLRRFARLYTVLIPALVLGGVLDIICTHINQYQHSLQGVAWTVHSFGPKAFVGNLAFLQGILVNNFGSNAPLWSLSYEFWYYIGFPFLAIGLWPNRSKLNRSLCIIALGCICCFVGKTISLYGLIWLMGAVINVLPVVKLSTDIWRRTLCFASIVAVLGFSFVENKMPWRVADFMLGVCVLFMIYAILIDSTTRLYGPYRYLAHRLSASSYTIYLVHVPLMILIVVIGKHDRWTMSPQSVANGLLIFVIVFAYSQMIYECFEKNTSEVLALLRPWALMRKDGTGSL
jgi:peptidoglycan/LPS O-acetylase OafA/YrhL